jgi:glycosyltransferase involved in cell wall biosynthesis
MHHRLLVEEVDGLLSLTEGGLEAARDAFPELAGMPAAVTPHGHYRDDYDFGATRREARARLGIQPDATLVVSVGMIREYKNVPALVRTVVSGDADLVLAVAGKPASPALAEEIRAAASDDPRIVLDLAFQSDEAMAIWLRAADLVVLPYRAIQNSGSALLALSADRPVVVPALGAMRELQEAVGPDWVRCFAGEFDDAELAASAAWATGVARPDRAPLDRLDWDRIAEDTAAFYRQVRGERAAPAPIAVHETARS